MWVSSPAPEVKRPAKSNLTKHNCKETSSDPEVLDSLV